MASHIKPFMGTREWAMLIVLSILWGGSFFFVGIAVNDLPPFTIVALRVGLAAILLWTLLFAVGQRPVTRIKIWLAFLNMGILNNAIPFVLIVWGQTQIMSGLASILNAATPIFTVVVAGLLLSDERITALKLSGVVLGFLGVIFMLGGPSLAGQPILGQVAILAAALSYAFAGAYGRRFKTMGISPLMTATGQLTTAALLLTPVALFIDGPVHVSAIRTEVIAAIAGLAVLSTSLAYVLYFKILASAGATNLLLVTFLVPVSAILLGFLFLNERLEPVHFLGMGLIAAGLFTIDGRIFNRKQ